MEQTLKERADEIEQKYKSYEYSIENADKSLTLIRDQQARIEELEAKTQWKPISDCFQAMADEKKENLKTYDSASINEYAHEEGMIEAYRNAAMILKREKDWLSPDEVRDV